MSIAKFFAVAAVAATTSCALADAANVLVSFSTTADKYADNTAVADGEWYALCWSSDGNFEGLNLDLSPIDANDLVIMKAPLAKGGRCPYTVFQIDSQSPNCKRTGIYSVVMLDTRDAAGKPATSLPTAVNAAAVSKEYQAGAATSGTTEKESEVAGEWAQSKIDTTAPGFKQPVITGFRPISDAKVEITVADMLPGVKYNIKMGETLDTMKDYSLETPKTLADENVPFEVNAKDAKFFKVVREPLTKETK